VRVAKAELAQVKAPAPSLRSCSRSRGSGRERCERRIFEFFIGHGRVVFAAAATVDVTATATAATSAVTADAAPRPIHRAHTRNTRLEGLRAYDANAHIELASARNGETRVTTCTSERIGPEFGEDGGHAPRGGGNAPRSSAPRFTESSDESRQRHDAHGRMIQVVTAPHAMRAEGRI
jgi:hypothetical protein